MSIGLIAFIVIVTSAIGLILVLFGFFNKKENTPKIGYAFFMISIIFLIVFIYKLMSGLESFSQWLNS